ncbi:AAA family ATPase [Schlegelella sp. S2-27]|uniref:AAA family ATPase n=1 Tax=Caldimonas mangrovi TaxID=2944811 RepID=A0ABT0YNZ6_9BURK|nr:AAA family ATPase [Caldimonas mangrovi]MCM5680114.1 AAA family ATPase [Caldimonas mangrovi]
MQLASLSVRNFRGIREADLRLNQHNVFIGANNSGKTTVIEALALLFGRDRMVRSLTEHDFYGGNPGPTDRIKLTATIVGFKSNDASKHTDWFGPDRAVPKWVHEETGELLPEPVNAKSVLACQVGFAARFERMSLEVETVRYFVDDAEADVFEDDAYPPVPSRLLREVGFFLVPASRTWDRVISFGSELFRRVLTSGDGLPAQAILSERDRLREPANPVETDPKLAPIVDELENELKGFFPQGPSLRLRLTSTDSDGVMESLVPHFAFGDAAPNIPARRHGTGLVSMQSLLLLFHFGRRRAKDGQSFWMALEEPELHIPPPLQRRVVQRLQSLSAQTFITSHSPTVAGMSDPKALHVLRNEGGKLTSTPLSTASSLASDSNPVRRLFEIHRQETIAALMHDSLLVPEGSIDVEILNLLAMAVDSSQTWESGSDSRFLTHVGIVRTIDAQVVPTYKRLHPLHPCIVCLVDGDEAGDGYIAGLAGSSPRPSRALRWPDSWAIEDAFGWVLDGDPSLAKAIDGIEPAAADSADLVARLKSKDRNAGGLKQDRLAYEAVAQAIARSEPARLRGLLLLNAMASECLGLDSVKFAEHSRINGLRVRVFVP